MSRKLNKSEIKKYINKPIASNYYINIFTLENDYIIYQFNNSKDIENNTYYMSEVVSIEDLENDYNDYVSNGFYFNKIFHNLNKFMRL